MMSRVTFISRNVLGSHGWARDSTKSTGQTETFIIWLFSIMRSQTDSYLSLTHASFLKSCTKTLLAIHRAK